LIRKCELCGEDIPNRELSTNNKKYKAKKFCSAKCHHQSMKQEFKYNCAECGEIVIRTKNNIVTNVFCDNTCKGKYAGKHYNKSGKKTDGKIIKKCENCKEDYEVIKSRSKTSKFCSITCRAEFNTKVSPYTQKVRVDIKCDNCDIKFDKVPSDIRKLNFCCTNCMYEYYETSGMFAGENSGTWNGGDEDYRGGNWRTQRRKVRERDNYTCQRCSITEEEYGHELSVHHIKPYRYFNNNYLEANKLENLICLCGSCHSSVHSKKYNGTKFLNIPIADVEKVNLSV
jgi:predicted HNH restriction endonuclease